MKRNTQKYLSEAEFLLPPLEQCMDVALMTFRAAAAADRSVQIGIHGPHGGFTASDCVFNCLLFFGLKDHKISLCFTVAMSASLKSFGRFEVSIMSAKFGCFRIESFSGAPYFAPPLFEIRILKAVSEDGSIPFVSTGSFRTELHKVATKDKSTLS